MAKRALIFSFVYYPRFIGGAEVAIKEITDRISGEELTFDLIALRLDSSLPKTETIGNVTVHRVGFATNHKASPDSLPWYLHLLKFAYPLLALLKARSLHNTKHFDFTWAMMANYSGFGALFFKMFHSDVPFLLTLQEGDPIDYIKKRTRFVSGLFRRIFTFADSVQAISNYLGDFAKDMGFEGTVHVVPNAVDTKFFSEKQSAEAMNTLKTKLGKGENDIFLITTSRLVVKNAVDDIIRSLAFLPANVKFLILGQGYEEVRLRSLAHELGVAERVQFLGFVSHADMPSYLHISDIFIRPSLSEGFGNSFVEAMAADIPVIATPVGGIVDFLFDEKTGLFCEVKNPESIARQVKRLLENPALREQIVLHARNMVFEKYDWNHIAQSMQKEVFDTVVTT